MPRRKLSEYRAKSLLYKELGQEYKGIEAKLGEVFDVPEGQYVVKVDQAQKKRGKAGLITVNRSANEAKQDVQDFFDKGFTSCLIDPFIEHEAGDEQYLSLRLTRDGIEVLYSASGGVDIESAKDSLTRVLVDSADDFQTINVATGINETFLKCLLSRIYPDKYAVAPFFRGFKAITELL